MILFDSTFVLNLWLIIDSIKLILNSTLGSFLNPPSTFYTPLRSNLFSIVIIKLTPLLLTFEKVKTVVVESD